MMEAESYLYKIEKTPIKGCEELLQHYPFMKLGCLSSIKNFSQKLLPLALEVIRANPDISDWLITSPPLAYIRSGANLLSRELHGLIADNSGHNLNIKYKEIAVVNTGQAGSVYRNLKAYSQMSTEERIKARLGEPSPILEENEFGNKGVIFVNDINVTGTQQRIMTEKFSAFSISLIHWLYIFIVDPILGQSDPEIESRINYLDYEDFRRITRSENIYFTGKYLAGLLSYDIEKIEELMQLMGQEKADILLSLTVTEGCWATDALLDKLNLIKSFSTSQLGQA